MKANEVTFYNGAKWAAISGAFTAAELREIADKIENPELRDTPKAEETEKVG